MASTSLFISLLSATLDIAGLVAFKQHANTYQISEENRKNLRLLCKCVEEFRCKSLLSLSSRPYRISQSAYHSNTIPPLCMNSSRKNCLYPLEKKVGR